MADEDRRRYNVGVTKIPFAERDAAHAILTEDDDRKFFDIIGADTPDDDVNFPVGAPCTYRVELTEAEAEAFRQASNCRYVVPDGFTRACGGVQMPSWVSSEFMRSLFPEAGTRWHGRDVLVGLVDAGTSDEVREFMNWDVVGTREFQDDPLGSDGITINHGCLVGPLLVPYGGRILDTIVCNDDGIAPNSASVAAMRWLADQGAEVINYSYSGTTDDAVWADAMSYLSDRNVQLFVAIGNEGTNTFGYPAAYSVDYSNVHSAIAFDAYTGLRWEDSNYNLSASGCAPGYLTLGLTPTGGLTQWLGSSAAAPNMAQLCARICTGGRFTAAQAGAALKENTRDTGQSADDQGGGAYSLKDALTALGAFDDGPARTNLSINPAAGTNTTGWTGTSLTRVTTLTGFPRATGVQGTTRISSARFPVTPGVLYTSSAYVKCTGATTVATSIEWRNSGGTVLSSSSAVSYGVQANGIQRVFRVATAPANAATGSLVVDPSSTTSTVVTAHLTEQGSVLGTYFDGASPSGTWLGTANNSASTRSFPLAEVAERKNLSSNPSLETSTAGYGALVRPGLSGFLPELSTFIRAPGGLNLGYSFFTGDGTTSTGADAAVILPPPTVAPSTSYTFSIHLLYSILGTNVEIQVEWMNAGGSVISTSTSDRNNLLTYEWTRYWFTAISPSTAVSAAVSLRLRGIDETAQQYVLFDALLVEASSTLGDYFDGSSEGAQWDGTEHLSTSTYASTATDAPTRFFFAAVG